MKNSIALRFILPTIALFTMHYNLANNNITFKEKMIEGWNNIKSYIPWWIKNPRLYSQANMTTIANFLNNHNNNTTSADQLSTFITSIYPILMQLDPPTNLLTEIKKIDLMSKKKEKAILQLDKQAREKAFENIRNEYNRKVKILSDDHTKKSMLLWESFFDTVRQKSTTLPLITKKKYCDYAFLLKEYVNNASAKINNISLSEKKKISNLYNSLDHYMIYRRVATNSPNSYLSSLGITIEL